LTQSLNEENDYFKRLNQGSGQYTVIHGFGSRLDHDLSAFSGSFAAGIPQKAKDLIEKGGLREKEIRSVKKVV